MGFTLTEHKCSLPDIEETKLRLHYTKGTVWKCDECGQFYGLNWRYGNTSIWATGPILREEWFWTKLEPPIGDVHTRDEVNLAFYEQYKKQEADRLAYNEAMKKERDATLLPKPPQLNEETGIVIIEGPPKKRRWRK